jgi:hypothetical protein
MASSERTNEATAAPTSSGTAAASNSLAPTEQASHEGQPGFGAGRAPETLSRSQTAATAIDGARISCLMNAQYHAGREAFLDTVHRWFMFAVIALGAGALIDVFHGLKELFAASAAIIAALDLTFDLSNRARGHAMQTRRYFELLAQLNANEKSPEQVHVCINQYSADEEPQYRVMLLACWNAAQSTIFGEHAIQYDISGWSIFSKIGLGGLPPILN